MGNATKYTTISRIAAADLSSYQFCAVYESTAKYCNVQTTGNGRILGILMNTPGSGEEALIAVSGVYKAKVNEACAVHKMLTVANAAGGKLELVDAANEYACALTLEAATAQGDVILVQRIDCFPAASEA